MNLLLPLNPFGPALCAGLLLAGCGLVRAASPPVPGQPVPVPVGKGSYASFPPPDTGQAVADVLAKTLFVDNPDNRPIPTNQWWTDLLVDRGKFGGQNWAFPLMLKADPLGVNVFYPIKWNEAGSDPVSDLPLMVHGTDFHPAAARVRSWGDWTVTFREAESAAKYWDVTMGRGLPYAWVECHGISPTLSFQGPAVFSGAAGQAVSLPIQSDQLAITYGGRSYGVFAPDGTKFAQTAEGVSVQFTGPKQYLVVCPLPKPADLAYFAKYAFAVPRDSRLSWTYDAQAAQVTTNWHLTTVPLKGAETRLIQGWLPHHYRGTVQTLAFNDLRYLTPRGTLKCAVGTDFRIVYPFQGFPPSLPLPKATGLPHDFDGARMHDYLTRYAAKTGYGDDTYWGGKSLTQFGQYLLIAQEMRDPAFEPLKASLRTALTDWFTYTPGEQAHYFARYPNWHALIGFKPSYGSEGFSDNHFHYSYFTTAAAMLGMADPNFLREYGGMARLLAKQYANWDRNDPDFPFLRTFDVWEGHSWASGVSSPTGADQESSSEAVQSWGGLFLLGTELGDKDMTAAGAMGYAMETQAAQEYWFNVHGDNFAPNFPHPITSMVWSGGNLYGTYFSGDPAWIYGIQWLPMSPMLSYLVRDPAYAKRSFREMLAARQEKQGSATISSMGPALGNVILGEAGQVNPDWAAEQMDALWTANDPVAHDNDTPGLMYYFAHANRHLGLRQWDWHLSLGTGGVFYDAATKVYRAVAYNPLAAPQRVLVYHGDKQIDSVTVPGGALVNHVLPASAR